MRIAYIAIILFLVTVGSVVFNFTTPFHFDAIGSNWELIDITVYITFVICGVAFVALGLLMAWWVYKFQYQEGKFAEYEPENAKLESQLTIITTIGVVVMLAPGLVAWNDYINPPNDAYELEVYSKQWSWMYRFPGADGIFGAAHNKYVDLDNPFGMKPDDKYGEDDILIVDKTVKIPVDRPVKVLLRSQDVLHDFWVPAMRAKMDAVPGMVTYFWFEPIVERVYEVLCAELCGRNHFNMRGEMHVVSMGEYSTWLNDQVTWAELQAGAVPLSPEAATGRDIANEKGCFACHSVDGRQLATGPTWLDIWGGTVELDDGTTRVRDEAYIVKSILDPHAEIVLGYTPTMTAIELTEEELQSILDYMKVLKSEPAETVIEDEQGSSDTPPEGESTTEPTEETVPD